MVSPHERQNDDPGQHEEHQADHSDDNGNQELPLHFHKSVLDSRANSLHSQPDRFVIVLFLPLIFVAEQQRHRGPALSPP